MRITPCLLLILAIAAAGCSGAGDPPTGQEERHASRPVVVALVDSGINPYHEAFRLAGPEAVSFLPPGAEVVNLTFAGGYESNVREDSAFWESVEMHKLYAFAGTRVLAISIEREEGTRMVLDDIGHGTGVASLVAHANPDAILVMIQKDGLVCNFQRPADQCPLAARTAKAVQWAAEQPWIDVISLSSGMTGNPPSSTRTHEEAAALLKAVAQAHASGKLVVNGVGNALVPPVGSYYSGPPGIIAVGGVEGNSSGGTVLASKTSDVSANYTVQIALRDSIDGYEIQRGTSFASPIVSGTLSRALQEIRLALGDDPDARTEPGIAAAGTFLGQARAIPPADLRHALNASALMFAPTAWQPPSIQEDPANVIDSANVPVLVAGPQMGWGYVHPGLATEIARRVLENDLAPPPEKAQVAAWQAQWHAAREEYWSQFGA